MTDESLELRLLRRENAALRAALQRIESESQKTLRQRTVVTPPEPTRPGRVRRPLDIALVLFDAPTSLNAAIGAPKPCRSCTG